MSKGIIEMMIFFIAFVALAVSSLITNAFIEYTIAKRGVMDVGVLDATTTMEFLKKSLQQSLSYSYYQASYDVAKSGGTSQTSLWRNYDDTSGYPTTFQQTLAGKTLNYFKEYTSTLSDKDITIPEYKEVRITRKGTIENIVAVSDGNLKISKVGSYELSNKGSVFSYLQTGTLTLFEIGRRDFIASDALSETIKVAEGKIPSQCRKIETTNICETQTINCKTELTNKCVNIENKFKDDILNEIIAKSGGDLARSLKLDITPVSGKLTDKFTFAVTFAPVLNDGNYEILFQIRKIRDTPFTSGKSKLGLHTSFLKGYEFEFIKETKPSIVKIFELGFDKAAGIKASSPSTFIVGRIYEASQPQDGNPEQRAQEWFDKRKNTIKSYSAIDCWEAYNEPTMKTINEASWLASFEKKRIELLASINAKACIGSFSTGTPPTPTEDVAIWEAYRPALEAAKANDGYLALHEYGAPDMKCLFDEKSGEGYLAARYRKFYQDYLIPKGLVIPLVITEAGIDGGVCGNCGCSVKSEAGWRSYTDSNAYINDLIWYDSILKADSYVIGATIYQTGIPDEQWRSFETHSDLTEFLKGYIGSGISPASAKFIAISAIAPSAKEWKNFGGVKKLSALGNPPYSKIPIEITPSDIDGTLKEGVYEFRVIAGKPLNVNSPTLASDTQVVVKDIRMNIKPGEIKTEYSASSNTVYGQQDSSCGCKPGTEQEVTASCPDDPSKQCSSKVCENYKKVTVACTYSYVGAVKAAVELTDMSSKYPVYDFDNKKSDMKNIQLNFNVISSNDYSKKLITQ